VRRHLTPLIFFVAISLGSFVVTLAVGNKPQYGLDLQGGISVVLRPTTQVPSDVLDRAVTIIRQRVDSLGVAEPEIGRQGNNVLVQLPGVQDQQRAIDLIGTTAELRFRPVLRDAIPPDGSTLESLGITPTTTIAGATTTPASTVAGATTTIAPATTLAPATTAAPTTTVAPATTASPGTTVAGATTTVAGAATTTGPTTTLTPDEQRTQTEEALGLNLQTTTREENTADATVILPEIDSKTKKETQRFQLGPAALKGDGIESAKALVQALSADSSGGWYVSLTLKNGDNGINALNTIAASCFSQAPECPTGKLGIELDGRVVFAGNVQSASFERDQISLSGNYSKKDASDIAIALRYGALPITLELQTTQTVSATLGSDALHAGVAAGLIGLAMVSILMVLYYRWLGLLAVVSLLLSAALLWSIIAYLGETQGLALTLAGVTGLVVSIGVSLDSSIVYFEHIKEDVWNGRTPRSAVDRAFKAAWSTIKKADFAALLGAAVLYFLTVGAVKGFALYLGLATIIDLICAFTFVAPAARIIARKTTLNEHPNRFGLPMPAVGDS
jgi:preprotein translocase subunit SecD